MKKIIPVILFSLCGVLVVFLVFLSLKKNSETITDGQNVHIENGIQIVEIRAGGGYSPRNSIAKAGIHTVLRFTTNGAFDCSSSIRIPSLSMSKILPQNGTEDIDLGTPKSGPLQGMCGMGMFPFSVDFQNI